MPTFAPQNTEICIFPKYFWFCTIIICIYSFIERIENLNVNDKKITRYGIYRVTFIKL